MLSVRAFTLAVILTTVTVSVYAKTTGGGVFATTTLVNSPSPQGRGLKKALVNLPQFAQCRAGLIGNRLALQDMTPRNKHAAQRA